LARPAAPVARRVDRGGPNYRCPRSLRAPGQLENYAALTTLPAFRQRVQTRRCVRRPSTMAWTRCRLGSVRFLVLLLAWLTWFPVSGPLPHTSHLNAICLSSQLRDRKERRNLLGNSTVSSRGDLLAAADL